MELLLSCDVREVLGVGDIVYSLLLGGIVDIETSIVEEDNLDGIGSVGVVLRAMPLGEVEEDRPLGVLTRRDFSDTDFGWFWRARLDKLDMLEIPESESESLYGPLFVPFPCPFNGVSRGRLGSGVKVSPFVEREGLNRTADFEAIRDRPLVVWS